MLFVYVDCTKLIDNSGNGRRIMGEKGRSRRYEGLFIKMKMKQILWRIED